MITPTPTVPDFRLPASTGQTLERQSFLGKVPMAISIHPGFSHGDTTSLLTEFNDRLAEFAEQRAQVLVVLPETASDVRAFASEHGIKFPVLADPGLEMARAFDATTSDGAVKPVLVVTDPDGKIVRRFDEAPEDGQAEAALSVIRAQGANWLDPA